MFVKERVIERKLSVWSPMKKVNLQTWKTTRVAKKSKTAPGVAALKDDRTLFMRFLVVVFSGPEIDLKESISEFELAAFPRSLFNSDGDLRHCVGKSKLMNVLENLRPHQLSDGQTEQHHDEGSVVIIDGMAIIRSMGKPTWVRTGRDLANHFLEIIDNKSKECEESRSSFIVATSQTLSKRELASFVKVPAGPWCTISPMMKSSKRSRSSSC